MRFVGLKAEEVKKAEKAEAEKDQEQAEEVKKAEKK